VRIAYVVRDVQALAESRRLAESDELTGLLNRRGFTLRLERALREVRHGGSELALLLIDLNRFKEVNDTLGHRPATCSSSRSPTACARRSRAPSSPASGATSSSPCCAAAPARRSRWPGGWPRRSTSPSSSTG
jgi:hypothetical protein